MAELTPMMRQYMEEKEKHPDSLLFFRLGDFYEMFGPDARTASRELDLALTTRDKDKSKSDEERIPMCGVPYHSAEGYIARLIAKGYKVSICEQMEDPALAKGLVKREIIRTVTPGTVLDEACLEAGRSNYLCGVYLTDTAAGLCAADISTGQAQVTAFTGAQRLTGLINELGRFAPAEAVRENFVAHAAPGPLGRRLAGVGIGEGEGLAHVLGIIRPAVQAGGVQLEAKLVAAQYKKVAHAQILGAKDHLVQIVPFVVKDGLKLVFLRVLEKLRVCVVGRHAHRHARKLALSGLQTQAHAPVGQCVAILQPRPMEHGTKLKIAHSMFSFTLRLGG